MDWRDVLKGMSQGAMNASAAMGSPMGQIAQNVADPFVQGWQRRRAMQQAPGAGPEVPYAPTNGSMNPDAPEGFAFGGKLGLGALGLHGMGMRGVGLHPIGVHIKRISVKPKLPRLGRLKDGGEVEKKAAKRDGEHKSEKGKEMKKHEEHKKHESKKHESKKHEEHKKKADRKMEHAKKMAKGHLVKDKDHDGMKKGGSTKDCYAKGGKVTMYGEKAPSTGKSTIKGSTTGTKKFGTGISTGKSVPPQGAAKRGY